MEQIRSFYLKFNEKLFEKVKGKLDIFIMGDDFGMQDSLICKKQLWERFFRPGLEKYISLARKYDIKIMHHSCGVIKPIIPFWSLFNDVKQKIVHQGGHPMILINGKKKMKFYNI